LKGLSKISGNGRPIFAQLEIVERVVGFGKAEQGNTRFQKPAPTPAGRFGDGDRTGAKEGLRFGRGWRRREFLEVTKRVQRCFAKLLIRLSLGGDGFVELQ
jgi:hypothetical protein